MSKSKALPILLIICIGLCIYYPAMRGPFLGDDYPAIVNNASLYQNGNLHSIYNASRRRPTRFIPFASFALNYHIHKLDVFGYHIFNLIIHLLNSIITYWLTLLILCTPRLKNNKDSNEKYVFAFLTALIFLTHPIQTQAVSYIHQRLASMATLFYLLSLCLYLFARIRIINNKSGHHFWAASVFVALCGVFTKEIIFTLPFVIILLELSLFDHRWRKRLRPPINQGKSRKILPMVMVFILTVLTIPLYYTVMGKNVFRPKYSQSHIGDIVTSQNYLMTQFRVVTKYVRLLFFPYNQTYDYDFPVSQSFFELTTFFSFVFLVAVLIFAFFLLKRNILMALGIFWLFITLSVESTIIPIRNVIWEHRLYLPMFGFAIFLNALISSLIKDTKKFKILMSCLVIILSFITFQRNILWGDSLKFWKDNTIKAPNKARSHRHLTRIYIERQTYDLAQKHAQKSIELDLANHRSYFNMATVYIYKENYLSALQYALRSFNINPFDEVNAQQVGYIYFQLGKYDECFQYYDKALSILQSNQALAQYFEFVIIFYNKTKRMDQAITYANRLRKFHRNDIADRIEKILIAIQKK